MTTPNDIKQQFMDARKRLAKHFYSELIEVEKAYADGQSEKLLNFGSLETGNWSQVQSTYLWVIQHYSEDDDLIELCSRYPAVAPNLLNALQPPDDRLNWLEISTGMAHQLNDIEIVKVHVGNMALTCRTAGRLEKQLQYIEELSKIYTSDKTAESSAVTSMLGEAYRLSGRYPEAIQSLEKAYPILEEWKHPLTSYAYHNLGITYRNIGNFEKSAFFHELEKEASESEGDWMSLSRSNVSLGILYQEELEVEKAIHYYEAAQHAIEKEEENPSPKNSYIFRLGENSRQAELAYGFSNENWQKFNKIPILGNKGALESQTGNYIDALHLLEGAIQLCRDLAQKRYEAIWLHKKGIIYANLGQFENSSICQNQSLDIANDIRATRAIGFAHFGLGKAEICKQCLQQTGKNPSIDVVHLVNAYEIAQKIKNVRDIQEWGAELAEAYIISSNFYEAQKIIETLIEIPVRENRYRVLALQGIILSYTGDLDMSRNYLNAALEEIEIIMKNEKRILNVLYVQGRVLCHIALTEPDEERNTVFQNAISVYKKAIELSPFAKGQMACEYYYLQNLQFLFPQYDHSYSEIRRLLGSSAAILEMQ